MPLFFAFGRVRELSVLTALAFAACARPTSDSTAIVDASAPVVTVPAMSAASIDASIKPTAPPAACSIALDSAAVSIDKVPASVIVHALVPSLVPQTMMAKVIKDKSGAPTVVDCLNDHADANWEGHDAPVPANGKVELVLRQPIDNGREIVWAMTGFPLGACSAEAGFAAVVHLEDGRVVADGVGAWSRECGKPAKLRVEKLAGVDAFVDTVPFDTGAQTSTTEDVWMVVGHKFVNVGNYEIAEGSGGLPDDKNLFTSMKGTSTFAGSDVTVHQQWLHAVDLSKASPGDKRETLDVRYHFANGKLTAVAPPKK